MFTHLYQRQHFKEAEVRVYGGEIVLALEHLHKVGEDLGLLRALGLGLVLGHPTGQPGCALSWVVLVGAGVAFPGLLEGKALVLPGEGSLPSPPLCPPPLPPASTSSKGVSSDRELGAAPGATLNRTSSNGDLMPWLPRPCNGSLHPGSPPSGSFGPVPRGSSFLAFMSEVAFPSDGPVPGPSPALEIPSLGGAPLIPSWVLVPWHKP